MTPDKLIKQLAQVIPAELASDLVSFFLQIRLDVSTKTLGRSAPGKFVETVAQILQFIESGKYNQNIKVDEYLRFLDSGQSKLPDDLRITLARVARSIYTIRNKRSIVHKGEIDLNIYDLYYLYSATQWVLSELVRNLLSTDVETSAKLIEFIQIPISPIVEDFGEKRLVLIAGTTEEELLVLLLHYFPVHTPCLKSTKIWIGDQNQLCPITLQPRTTNA